MTDLKKSVELLIEKAAKAEDSNDALKLSQAAANSANAMCSLADLTEIDKPDQD